MPQTTTHSHTVCADARSAVYYSTTAHCRRCSNKAIAICSCQYQCRLKCQWTHNANQGRSCHFFTQLSKCACLSYSVAQCLHCSPQAPATRSCHASQCHNLSVGTAGSHNAPLLSQGTGMQARARTRLRKRLGPRQPGAGTVPGDITPNAAGSSLGQIQCPVTSRHAAGSHELTQCPTSAPWRS